jgi:hypothetical protein
MQRRTALTVTGAIALTIAAGSAAMAANLGILDRDNGVDVGDLSPVGSSSSVSTPVTVDDSAPATAQTTPSTPVTVDDHGTDITTPGTVGSTTPVTVDDHGGDDDHSGPGRNGSDDGADDHSGSGHGGDDDRTGDDNSGHGGGDD